nr:MAG TPA: portal protein [Caudoviricetes sp.]
MIDLSKLQPIGRKQWVKRKWDEYVATRNYLAIVGSLKAYYDPTNVKFDEVVDKATWKDTVDRKVNYLLARKPICTDHQDTLDSLLEFVRESATQYLLTASLVWIVQGNGVDFMPKPAIMKNTIAIYGDEARQETVAYIRKRIDIEVDEMTGAETEREYYECYYQEDVNGALIVHRDTYCYTLDNADTEEVLVDAPVFIELGKTGDAPLYAYVENYLKAHDNLFKHQDQTVCKNTKPLVEVRGYSGTADEDLAYAIEELSIARVDGNGGVAIHQRSMDSNSVDLWRKALMTKYYEATCTVGKDNELQYAVSGKAMDRLFVDMENSARQLSHILEQGLIEYFESIGQGKVGIVWNTDRPVDDASIISAIAQSRGIVSDLTLLEQHPWIEDVDEEVKRLAEQNSGGFDDLMEVPDDTI